jgi:hypothetical protein
MIRKAFWVFVIGLAIVILAAFAFEIYFVATTP